MTVPDVLSIDDSTNYWIALGFMVVSGAILFVLSRSALGLILQASGQDSVAAGTLGFNVTKHKLAAFCISALFSGLSGALLIFYFGTASVGTVVDIAVGVQIIIACVLGGRRTILGAAVGAVTGAPVAAGGGAEVAAGGAVAGAGAAGAQAGARPIKPRVPPGPYTHLTLPTL